MNCQISTSTMHKKNKRYNKKINNTFKFSCPNWKEKFEILDRSCSVAGIHDYFEFNIKKHDTLIDNPPMQIYINKIDDKVTFKIKSGHYLGWTFNNGNYEITWK